MNSIIATYPIIKRALSHLRIRLTSHCNYKCTYCLEEGFHNKEKQILPFSMFKNIIQAAKNNGINKIILTGGEPLLYPYIKEALYELKRLEFNYHITSNFSVFQKRNLIEDELFRQCEYHISIDTLDIEHYSYLSGLNNLSTAKKYITKITDAIHSLKKFNAPMQINTVVMSEVDTHYHSQLFDFARTYDLPIKMLTNCDYNMEKDNITTQQLNKILIKSGAIPFETKEGGVYNKFNLNGVYIRTLNVVYGKSCENCPIGKCGEGLRFVRCDCDGTISSCFGNVTGIIKETSTIEEIQTQLTEAKNQLKLFI